MSIMSWSTSAGSKIVMICLNTPCFICFKSSKSLTKQSISCDWKKIILTNICIPLSLAETRLVKRSDVCRMRPRGVLISCETVEVRFSSQSYCLSFYSIFCTNRCRWRPILIFDR